MYKLLSCHYSPNNMVYNNHLHSTYTVLGILSRGLFKVYKRMFTGYM